MGHDIAIVGLACRYPEADSALQLWENVLSQRRSFRRIPPSRLRAEDYLVADRAAPDAIYAWWAALLEGYEFDRARFRISGPTFRATDLTHWLALEVADDVLTDAGFGGGNGLPRERTGVVVGNTLTGEMSRSATLRLRWPYVRRVVGAELVAAGMEAERIQAMLAAIEASYKAPFPPVGEDSLVGALSNSIAGRICNYFDLGGGGYTVDGACASSMLAVTTVCAQLVAGDIDVGLAGGVDISIDPFELVGFAKTGALAAEEMRVYDRRAGGFWPGEGCGFAVLMRGADATAQGRRIYGYIRGWGVSADGAGGITRPEVAGQKLALRRAYERAEVDVEAVAYHEGHGTGTAVGDGVELAALSEFRAEHGATSPAVVGSVKANIGHTKAAAGMAGLIKTAMALHSGVLPPNTACERPHELVAGENGLLAVSRRPRRWPAQRPCAGVSGAGFGGINAHVVLEAPASASESAPVWGGRVRVLERTAQDAELFLFGPAEVDALAAAVGRLRSRAAQASWGELRDLAGAVSGGDSDGAGEAMGLWRAATVARTPEELLGRLERLEALLRGSAAPHLDLAGGVFVGRPHQRPRIGLLFPGQGVAASLDGGAWSRRFDLAADLYASAGLDEGASFLATTVSQPAIATAALVGLAILEELGIDAELGLGHSVGELCAYGWAGGLARADLLGLMRGRASAMAATCASETTMASVSADAETVRSLLSSTGAVIAAFNAPRQVVVAGSTDDVVAVMQRAEAQGISSVRLSVAHAFHSPFMAEAAGRLDALLDTVAVQPLRRRVISTITGEVVGPGEDLRRLLVRQLTAPVLFHHAAEMASAEVDAFVEVGPGQVLSRLIADRALCLPLDVGGESLRGLLVCAGVAHVLGVAVRTAPLFADRALRPVDLDRHPALLANPCETAPFDTAPDIDRRSSGPAAPLPPPAPPATPADTGPPTDVDALVRALVAAHAELDPAVIDDEDRLLGDLHMSSVTVGQIVQEALSALSRPPALAPPSFANLTVAELGRAVSQLASADVDGAVAGEVEGIGPWVGAFRVGTRPRSLPAVSPVRPGGDWTVLAAPDARTFAGELRGALSTLVGGGGVAVYLRPGPIEADLEPLVSGARRAVSSPTEAFVVVQHGPAAAAFARSVALEAPELDTCVVELSTSSLGPETAVAVAAEVAATQGFRHVILGPDGARAEPVLTAVGALGAPAPALGPDDVVLVTGGGKGIGAECALALAAASGARLALVGRARLGDVRLDATLERMAAAGVAASYQSADVSDPASLRRAIDALQHALGPVTAVIHSAGVNIPTATADLDVEAVLATLRPKVVGLRHVLECLDADRLGLVVAFGSLIARTGFRGEAHYGLANEWLSLEVERFGRAHPGCRCLALEWSVWAGAGMAERLGAVEAMAREGIEPLAVDQAVTAMMNVLSHPELRGPIVISGRFGNAAASVLASPEPPLLRFLERPRISYPGIELVVDNDVRAETDPYLGDHVLDGNQLMPAVVAFEAMAQAATAVSQGAPTATPVVSFHGVEFTSPLVVPQGSARVLRLATQVRDDQSVDVAVRSDESRFLTDHVRAVCRLGQRGHRVRASECPSRSGAAADVDVGRDMYESVLFQSGRFRRLVRYRALEASWCQAEVLCRAESWFGPFLPAQLLLGDPGVRDAALHCVQACIPHLPVLPVGVGSLRLFEPTPEGVVLVTARETARAEAEFSYDIEISTLDGWVCERWNEVRFRASGRPVSLGAVPSSLLGVALERCVQDFIGNRDLRLVIDFHGGHRGESSNGAFVRILDAGTSVERAADGRPYVPGASVSAAHTRDITVAVAGSGTVACDIETVNGRDETDWRTVLGPQRWSLAQAAAATGGLSVPTAAAVVWAAGECLVKAGLSPRSHLALSPTDGREGWLVLSTPRHRIVATALAGEAEVALAVLGERSGS